MNAAELKNRYREIQDQLALRAAWIALAQSLVKAAGVSRVEELDEPLYTELEEAFGELPLRSHADINAALDDLKREAGSREIVLELRRIYGLPDTRPV